MLLRTTSGEVDGRTESISGLPAWPLASGTRVLSDLLADRWLREIGGSWLPAAGGATG